MDMNDALFNKLDSLIRSSDKRFSEDDIKRYVKPWRHPKKLTAYLADSFPRDLTIHTGVEYIRYPGFLTWVLDENLCKTYIAPSSNPLFKTYESKKIDHQRELEMVKWMVSKGVKISETNGIPRSAGLSGNISLIEFIIGYYSGATEYIIEVASTAASEAGNIDMLKYFHHRGYKIPENLLKFAAKFGHYDIVVWLADHVIPNVDAHSAIIVSMFNDCYDIFLYLWKKYPDSKYRNNQLLTYAIYFNKMKVVKLLLKHQREESYGFFTDQDYACNLLRESIRRGFVEISEVLYKLSLVLGYTNIYKKLRKEELKRETPMLDRKFRSLRMICKYRWIKHRMGWESNNHTVANAITRSELPFIKWLYINMSTPYDSCEIGNIENVDGDVILWLAQNRFTDLHDKLISAVIKTKNMDAINSIINRVLVDNYRLTRYHKSYVFRTEGKEIYFLFEEKFPDVFLSEADDTSIREFLEDKRFDVEFKKFLCYEYALMIKTVYLCFGSSHREWFFTDYIYFMEKFLAGNADGKKRFHKQLYKIAKTVITDNFNRFFSKENGRCRILSCADFTQIMSMADKLEEDMSKIIHENE